MIWVDRPYALAIETALGANIQNLVVEDEASAKAAISALKRENAGRATFYPLTSIKSSSFNGDLNALAGQAGFIGLASNLVRHDSRYTNIISYLLGRTLLFDTLDNATKSAKASGYRHRIVTLDGQIINAGGSFTGGSTARESGILTRSAEIEEILTQQKKLEVQLAQLKERYGKYDSFITDAEHEIENLNSEMSLLSVLYNSEQSNLSMLEGRLKEENQNLASLLTASGRLDEAEAEKLREAEELTAKSEQLSATHTALSASLDKLSNVKSLTAKRLEESISKKNAGLVTISIQTKELERLDERIAEAMEQKRLLEEALVQTLARSDSARIERSKINDQLTQDDSALQALNTEIDQIKLECRSLTDRTMELDQQINAIRKTAKE